MHREKVLFRIANKHVQRGREWVKPSARLNDYWFFTANPFDRSSCTKIEHKSSPAFTYSDSVKRMADNGANYIWDGARRNLKHEEPQWHLECLWLLRVPNSNSVDGRCSDLVVAGEFLLGWDGSGGRGCGERLVEGFSGCHRFTLGVLIRFHVSNVMEVASVW